MENGKRAKSDHDHDRDPGPDPALGPDLRIEAIGKGIILTYFFFIPEFWYFGIFESFLKGLFCNMFWQHFLTLKV